MLPFLEKIFSSKKKSNNKGFVKKIAKLSILTEEINTRQEKLNELEYEIINERSSEYFLSLKDFLELMNCPNLVIRDIIQRCQHISELDPTLYSSIDVYAVVENDHIVLCPDIKECEIHKEFKGDPIHIVSVRR